MRRILLIVASLALVSAVLAAHGSERVTKSDLTVPNDVTFGTTVIKAGEYKVVCDREMVTLMEHDTGKVALKVECKGRELDKESPVTALHISTDPSGAKTVTKLLLKGSHIEHVF